MNPLEVLFVNRGFDVETYDIRAEHWYVDDWVRNFFGPNAES